MEKNDSLTLVDESPHPDGMDPTLVPPTVSRRDYITVHDRIVTAHWSDLVIDWRVATERARAVIDLADLATNQLAGGDWVGRGENMIGKYKAVLDAGLEVVDQTERLLSKDRRIRGSEEDQDTEPVAAAPAS